MVKIILIIIASKDKFCPLWDAVSSVISLLDPRVQCFPKDICVTMVGGPQALCSVFFPSTKLFIFQR